MMGELSENKTKYLDPESGRDLTAEELAKLPPEEQKRIIKHWFLEHYENPAENTPYESAEGGYIYIWGGPHEADEVLWSEFCDIIPENFLLEIAEELEEECGTDEWASIPGPEDFDLSYLVSDFYPRFENGVETLRRLLGQEIDENDQASFFALLYVNAITLLEAYLSDVFISLVVKHQSLLRKFVESDSVFKALKITTADIFRQMESIPVRVKNHLYVLPFHRLEKVQKMYSAVLGITFPPSMIEILKAVQVRHDIVHRNGLTKDGALIILPRADVENLLIHVEQFVSQVDREVRELAHGLAAS
ncbi:MAG TPA: hypothetical protein VEP30_00945 [Chthoniobacterales bacterium]|nr:hypothetical protein [Chthoniobacterales bacterium]